MRHKYLTLTLILMALFNTARAASEELLIATAANFSPAAREIIQRFNQTTEHHAKLISASNGKLYAQIVNGAPFDVLLAADTQTPSRLAANHNAVAASQFTYAQGRLALLTSDSNIFEKGLEKSIEKNLRDNTQESDFKPELESDSEAIKNIIERWLKYSNKKIAIANPNIAPYGRAAIETLTSLDLYQVVKLRLVQAENISQAHQFISTGNAALGFIALSHAKHSEYKTMVIAEQLHQPIQQDAILLTHGADNIAALEFLNFLQKPIAQKIIEQYGYTIK